jgi:hypothetical protein
LFELEEKAGQPQTALPAMENPIGRSMDLPTGADEAAYSMWMVPA